MSVLCSSINSLQQTPSVRVSLSHLSIGVPGSGATTSHTLCFSDVVSLSARAGRGTTDKEAIYSVAVRREALNTCAVKVAARIVDQSERCYFWIVAFLHVCGWSTLTCQCVNTLYSPPPASIMPLIHKDRVMEYGKLFLIYHPIPSSNCPTFASIGTSITAAHVGTPVSRSRGITKLGTPDPSRKQALPVSKYKYSCEKIAINQKYTFLVPRSSQVDHYQMATRRSCKPDVLRDTFIPSSLKHVREPDIRISYQPHPAAHNNKFMMTTGAS